VHRPQRFDGEWRTLALRDRRHRDILGVRIEVARF